MFWPCFSFLSSLELCSTNLAYPPCHSQRERETWEAGLDAPQIIHCGRGKQGASSDARKAKLQRKFHPHILVQWTVKTSIEQW